jgi:hypothetical protein
MDSFEDVRRDIARAKQRKRAVIIAIASALLLLLAGLVAWQQRTSHFCRSDEARRCDDTSDCVTHRPDNIRGFYNKTHAPVCSAYEEMLPCHLDRRFCLHRFAFPDAEVVCGNKRCGMRPEKGTEF